MCPMTVWCARASITGEAYEGTVERFECRDDMCYPVITLRIAHDEPGTLYTPSKAAHIFEMRHEVERNASYPTAANVKMPNGWLMHLDLPSAYENTVRGLSRAKGHIRLHDVVPLHYRTRKATTAQPTAADIAAACRFVDAVTAVAGATTTAGLNKRKPDADDPPPLTKRRPTGITLPGPLPTLPALPASAFFASHVEPTLHDLVARGAALGFSTAALETLVCGFFSGGGNTHSGFLDAASYGALSPGVTPTPCPSPFEISPPMSAFDAFDDSDAFDSAWRGVRRTVSECVQDGLPGNAPTRVATPLSTVSSVPMSTSMVGGRHERAANRTVNRNVDSVGVDPKLLQCITSPHLPAPIALGSVEI